MQVSAQFPEGKPLGIVGWIPEKFGVIESSGTWQIAKKLFKVEDEFIIQY